MSADVKSWVRLDDLFRSDSKLLSASRQQACSGSSAQTLGALSERRAHLSLAEASNDVDEATVVLQALLGTAYMIMSIRWTNTMALIKDGVSVTMPPS
jgi:hypothetical protein